MAQSPTHYLSNRGGGGVAYKDWARPPPPPRGPNLTPHVLSCTECMGPNRYPEKVMSLFMSDCLYKSLPQALVMDAPKLLGMLLFVFAGGGGGGGGGGGACGGGGGMATFTREAT